MTRAEKRAFEKYPKLYGGSPYGPLPVELNIKERQLFIEGYEQAEKDTIERAVEWLEANANKYIVDLTPTYPDAPQELVIGGMCWEDLKKAMEKEEQ